MKIYFRGLADIFRPRQIFADLAQAKISGVVLPLGAYFYWDVDAEGIHRKREILPCQMKIDVDADYGALAAFAEPCLSAMQKYGLTAEVFDMPSLGGNLRQVKWIKQWGWERVCDVLKHVQTVVLQFASEKGIGTSFVYYMNPPEMDNEEIYAFNKDYYVCLGRMAADLGITLLFTNQLDSVGGHIVRGSLADGREMAQWVDSLNAAVGTEVFGVNFHTGNANLCGQDMQMFIREVGHRLKAVTVCDNDGRHYASLLPFSTFRRGEYATDWLGLIRGLRDVDFDGSLIFEANDTIYGYSPLLRPHILQLAKAVADYLAWQVSLELEMKRHDKIVLFGAGNMCRNYMKNYGDKYPPLFTCDNNSARWGEMFCGLEIKNPQVLRDLPDDVCVFICNVYYREIEAQLRDLGVKNIAFFNDEYMPTFHYDRLERG